MTITAAIRKSRRAIIPYVTAGLPDFDTTGEIIKALSDAGAATIEIGIPFSDPMADGPVLQRASKASLDAGFSMGRLFKFLPEWTERAKCPLIMMSYINPLMRSGLERTLARLKESGIKGVIIPDMPSDGADVFNTSRMLGIDLIRLLAPTTTVERRREVLSQCSGFVYAVAVKGVTGTRKTLSDEVKNQVSGIKGMTELPVCVGFGVSSKKQVDEILTFADGVIVGSYLMEGIMSAGDKVNEAKKIMGSLLKGAL